MAVAAEQIAKIDGKKVTLFTYLRGSLFDTHSLTPAVEWVEAPYPGQVSNVARSGRVLSWTGLENVRYTVYAVPSDIAPENFYKDAEYLLGVSYEPSFEIPAADADYRAMALPMPIWAIIIMQLPYWTAMAMNMAQCLSELTWRRQRHRH